MTRFDQPLVDPLTYEEYRTLTQQLFDDACTTSGEPTAQQLEDTKLNLSRMRRLDRGLAIVEELKAAIRHIGKDQTWFVLSEGWCGDAAQTLPMLAQAAAVTPRVTLRVLLRDRNLHVMDRFLTAGTRSIPIAVITETDTRAVLGTWGPRPLPARELVAEFKKDPSFNKEAMYTALHLWYAQDKTVSAQRELAALLRSITVSEVH
jgi:hypothetical protein